MTATERNQLVLDALMTGRGFVYAMAISREGGVETVRDTLTKFDRAIGSMLIANAIHDAGAYARCSFCLRYCADARSLSGGSKLKCDCGECNGWTGSFVSPGADAEWSIGVHGRGAAR